MSSFHCTNRPIGNKCANLLGWEQYSHYCEKKQFKATALQSGGTNRYCEKRHVHYVTLR